MEQERKALDRGVEQLGLTVDETVCDKLITYLQLLTKWNRAYNLTAIREPEQMVIRHLLDSLAVVPHLSGNRIVDVGTGAGLPGIPLALFFPEKEFVLLDSNGKKCRFLVQVRAELGLQNVEVVHSRVEDYRPEQLFNTVITRAFASVADILTGSRHLISPDGVILAMKGALHGETLDELPGGFQLLDTITLMVPGLEQEQRHLLRLGSEQQ